MSTTTVIARPVTGLQNLSALVGRLLIAALFLPAGIGKVTGFAGTVAYVASAGLPMPTVGAALAAAVEILCSIALIVGLRTRPAALVLGVFTMAASFFFHAYWAADPAHFMAQYLNFYKNVAIFGGLLGIFAWGAGAFSLDARRVA
ncbi:DoxX family membrane protein [Xylophilus sp. Kf1]|nr:DoxX family membrane protein [Xylophilus sp. Kf1]